jgi:hypothetical protein
MGGPGSDFTVGAYFGFAPAHTKHRPKPGHLKVI